MDRPIFRRDALKAGLAALTAPTGVAMAAPPAGGVRAFQLVEPAGLRRFGYPVHTLVPAAGDGRHFRLIRDGRAIPAQFRPVQGPGGRAEIALDFIASPGPLESARYEVHFGMGVEPGPEPKGGLAIVRRDARYLVSQGNSLAFEVAEDLSGFLRGVGSPRLGYLRDSPGSLTIRENEATSPRPIDLKPASVRSRVTREGPFAVGLRFEWSTPSGSRSTLDLTVPHSKSWVQGAWSVDDPSARVVGLSFDLPLLIEGSPTLVDLGAGSTVYGQIKGTQRMELESARPSGATPTRQTNPGWVVRQGDGEEPAILAASSPESPRAAEGWAHIMDSRRCTALAVANFGRAGGKDRISVGADGTVRLDRDFSDGGIRPGPAKVLDFWLHFVPMPVQIGAATSPQAILSPLRVEWDRSPG